MEIQKAIQTIITGQDLAKEEIISVMNQILKGSASETQIGAFLASLSMKGETIDEVIGSAQVLRELSSKVIVDKENLVDTCGTGGIGSGIFNVSTTAAFVASSCGARVAKHGNRSSTRKSGSADLLEASGVSLDLDPSQVKTCIEVVGIGFMFAPAHHSAMKHAIGPRKELGIKTIFNLLGPLTNPAGAFNQVVGVFDIKWVKPIAEVLKGLGSRHVLVVHSEDGLDEISIAAPTNVAELKDGVIKEYSISPKDFGLKTHSIENLRVDSAEESLALAKKALTGKHEVASQMVALTAGAALYVSGVVGNLREGIDNSLRSIANGKGLEKLKQLSKLSESLIKQKK